MSEVELILKEFVEAGQIEPYFDEEDYRAATQTITNLIAQEANKAVVAELKLLKTKKVKGANLVELKWVDDRLGRLTVDKEQA